MNDDHVNLLLCSDLHLDVGHYALREHIDQVRQDHRLDAVILAGDIVEVPGGSPVKYALEQVPNDIPAFFVPGNHDFYGSAYGLANVLNVWEKQAQNSHVHLFTEKSFVLSSPSGGKVVLLGSTLWSNLQGLGPLVESELLRNLPRQIADFSCMRASDGSPWKVRDMLAQFDKGLLFLEKELSRAMLQDGRRRVVITHFGPHKQSIQPRWASVDASAYFCNHLPELVEKADLWLHGHTHDQFEYQVGDDPCLGRVVCHPRGYAGGREKGQAQQYAPRLLSIPVKRVPWEL